jgi:hypothetical protein
MTKKQATSNNLEHLLVELLASPQKFHKVILPSEIGMLSKLKHLRVLGKRLSGVIPKEFGRLTNLETLEWYYTSVSCDIPSELGQLSSLRFLGLSDTSLSGKLPKQLNNIKSLAQISLCRTNVACSGVMDRGNWSCRICKLQWRQYRDVL